MADLEIAMKSGTVEYDKDEMVNCAPKEEEISMVGMVQDGYISDDSIFTLSPEGTPMKAEPPKPLITNPTSDLASKYEDLLFSNDNAFKDKIRVANDRLAGELAKLETNEALVQRAIQAVYSRLATAEEIEAISAYLEARSDRREDAISQIVWALMTSSELRFNH